MRTPVDVMGRRRHPSGAVPRRVGRIDGSRASTEEREKADAEESACNQTHTIPDTSRTAELTTGTTPTFSGNGQGGDQRSDPPGIPRCGT